MIIPLKSKLTLPRLPSTIQRQRLFSLVENSPIRKITTIVAGAGFGKTTLATQIINLLGFKHVWYRLDQSDVDFFTFLSYLVTGFRKYYSDFGQDTLNRIQQTRSLKQEWQSILTVFLSEIDHYIDDNFLVVVDDYHLIQENHEINELTGYVLERINPLVHLIIISRTEPKIPLARYRAIRELTEITESDLRFTNSEIRLMFQQLFELPLEEKSLEILLEKTGGWISGVILFYHTLKGKPPEEIRCLLDQSKGTNRFIASYLEENVFSQQSEKIKDFLQRTSFFPQLDVEFCNEVLEIDDAADILEYLETNHLFTFPLEENRSTFFYHHLFQDFLKKRFIKECDKNDYEQFHRKAAQICHNKGLEENALGHYLSARLYQECCTILNQIGKDLLKAGKFRQLESYLISIPRQYLDKEPWLLYSQARIYDLSGQPKMAITYYRKAHGKFAELDIKKGAGLCLNALGNNYFQTGNFHQAEKKLEEVLGSFREDNRVTLNILTHLVFISSHLGKMEKADQYFERGVNLAEIINEKGLLESLYLNQGFRYGCSGDLEKALELAWKAHDAFKDEKLHHLLAFNHHLIAWISHYLGEYEQGYENAQKGLEVTRRLDFRDSSYAWLLMDVALNAIPLTRENEALEHASKALEAFKSMENRWGQAYSLHILQLAYMATGNLIKAQQAGEQSLERIDGLSLPFEDSLFGSHLANLYLETGNYQPALPLLEKARKLVGKATFFSFQIEVWLAKYYFKTDQLELAKKKLKACLSEDTFEKYHFCLHQEREWLLIVLPGIDGSGFKQSDIERLVGEKEFSSAGKSTVKPEISSPITAIPVGMQLGDLSIYCLGPFKVFTGGQEIPQNRWSSQKAKLLLKYLIQQRTKGYIDKELLIEFLWPESSSSKASHRLQVALSTLRQILGSTTHKKGASDQYIKRDGNAYLLTPGENGWIDCDRFLEEVTLSKQNPETAVVHLLKAETLYQGEYMQEEPYVEIFESKREFYKEKYLQVLQNLIRHFDAEAGYEKCIEYVEKSLTCDPYNEVLYCALMKYHSFYGNKRKIKQIYQNCTNFLKSGFDEAPSTETSTLYQQLITRG
ncbi:hypothetical protein KJ966_27235 [bacterium]|nr:hypothetical protein [bacterium]